MTTYEHRQAGATMWWSLFAGALGTVVILAILWEGIPPAGAKAVVWVEVGIVGTVVLLAWLFGSLTVTVSEEDVAVRFGPGWIRKSFPLAGLAEVLPVRNKWWYGWGIRYTPTGWLYNVSGLDAVELEYLNQKRVRIGTDEPEALAIAIRQAAGL